MAQALIAIVLQRPNDARGGPTKVLNDDNQYAAIFGETTDRDLYVVCMLLDKLVEKVLENRANLTKEERRDIRYYVDMTACCYALKTAKPTVKELVTLLKRCSEQNINDEIDEAIDDVLKKYKQLGATDKVAKGPDLTSRLLEGISDRFSAMSKAAKAG